MAERFPLARAEEVAAALAVALEPACDRIQIAGSIRRRAADVKDIEVVVVPRVRRDLFGEIDEGPTVLDALVDVMIAAGRLAPRLSTAGVKCMGRRHKRLTAVRSGVPVDLFAVLPPAQWGAILAIRTGPADYSKTLVTECQRAGLVCRDGALWRGSDVVPTPEEVDFIRECGLHFQDPWKRR